MSDAKASAAKSPTQSEPVDKAPPGSWKRKLLKWTVLFVLFLLAAFLVFRWGGTTTYRGTVARVYEKGAEYRIEFTELSGDVHVLGNHEITFPYVKVDTADLHAELNRLAQSGDIVDARVWGFRQAWLSMFPNVVDVEFVRSDSDRLRAKAEVVADEVLQTLRDKGVLKGGDGVRADVILAVERGMKAKETVDSPSEPTSEN